MLLSISNRHAVPVDQVPTLPAREEKDANHDEGECQSGWQDCSFAGRVSRVPIVERDIAARMPPRIIQCADSRFAQKIDETEDRRQGRHDEARSQEPEGPGGPERISGSPERQVTEKRKDKERN